MDRGIVGVLGETARTSEAEPEAEAGEGEGEGHCLLGEFGLISHTRVGWQDTIVSPRSADWVVVSRKR
jgi:hypothetical protein